MSDSFFDADRACGLYPPKLFGWQDKHIQIKMIKDGLKNKEPWAIEYAKYYGINYES